MKYTVGQIRQMLQELDQEFPEIDENERAADRAQTIRMMARMVSDWLARGYSYAQIAEKLRMKGFIRISEKALRHAATHPKRRRKAGAPEVSEKVETSRKSSIAVDKPGAAPAPRTSVSGPAGTQADQPPGRSSGFTPRADSDDI